MLYVRRCWNVVHRNAHKAQAPETVDGNVLDVRSTGTRTYRYSYLVSVTTQILQLGHRTSYLKTKGKIFQARNSEG
jgi:hypothetical protein